MGGTPEYMDKQIRFVWAGSALTDQEYEDTIDAIEACLNSLGTGLMSLITNNLVAWFDGSDNSQFTLNGLKVITWGDKSDESRDITQSVVYLSGVPQS